MVNYPTSFGSVVYATTIAIFTSLGMILSLSSYFRRYPKVISLLHLPAIAITPFVLVAANYLFGILFFIVNAWNIYYLLKRPKQNENTWT